MSLIADNLARLRERIASAAEQAGREPSEISLVAVTKKQSPDIVREAIASGVTAVGENYVQEAIDKRASLLPSQVQSLQWHMLGHLQSNKAGVAVDAFALIQSVDSVRLAQVINRQAGAWGKVQPILLQVHLGNESTKFGLSLQEVQAAAPQVGGLPGLQLCGLMGIAPFGEAPRPYFRQLRQVFEDLPTTAQHILSMGMTGDFEAAIQEGSTMVRIGTALFGPRG